MRNVIYIYIYNKTGITVTQPLTKGEITGTSILQILIRV